MSYTVNSSDFNCTVEENTRLEYDLIRLQYDTNKHCNQVDHIYESCTLTLQDNSINNTESCIQRFHSFCEVKSDSRNSNRMAPCKLFEIKRNEDCFCIKPNGQDNQNYEYTYHSHKFPKSKLQCVCLLNDKNLTISERQRHIKTSNHDCICPVFFRKTCSLRNYNKSTKNYNNIYCEIKDTSAPFEHFLLGYNGPINMTTTTREMITDNDGLVTTPNVHLVKLNILGINSGFIIGIFITSFVIIFLMLFYLGATKYAKNRELELYKLAFLKEQVFRMSRSDSYLKSEQQSEKEETESEETSASEEYDDDDDEEEDDEYFTDYTKDEEANKTYKK